MKKDNLDFEKFMTERFVEFYNEKESTNFHIKTKADEEEREKPKFEFVGK